MCGWMVGSLVDCVSECARLSVSDAFVIGVMGRTMGMLPVGDGRTNTVATLVAADVVTQKIMGLRRCCENKYAVDVGSYEPACVRPL